MGGSEPRDTALLVQFEVYISHSLSGGPPLFAQDLLIMVVSGSKKKKKKDSMTFKVGYHFQNPCFRFSDSDIVTIENSLFHFHHYMSLENSCVLIIP